MYDGHGKRTLGCARLHILALIYDVDAIKYGDRVLVTMFVRRHSVTSLVALLFCPRACYFPPLIKKTAEAPGNAGMSGSKVKKEKSTRRATARASSSHQVIELSSSPEPSLSQPQQEKSQVDETLPSLSQVDILGYYECKAILGEKKNSYLIDWVGVDPDTNRPWAPTWEPKAGVDRFVVKKWQKLQKQKKREKEEKESKAKERRASRGLRAGSTASGSTTTEDGERKRLQRRSQRSGPGSPSPELYSPEAAPRASTSKATIPSSSKPATRLFASSNAALPEPKKRYLRSSSPPLSSPSQYVPRRESQRTRLQQSSQEPEGSGGNKLTQNGSLGTIIADSQAQPQPTEEETDEERIPTAAKGKGEYIEEDSDSEFVVSGALLRGKKTRYDPHVVIGSDSDEERIPTTAKGKGLHIEVDSDSEFVASGALLREKKTRCDPHVVIGSDSDEEDHQGYVEPSLVTPPRMSDDQEDEDADEEEDEEDEDDADQDEDDEDEDAFLNKNLAPLAPPRPTSPAGTSRTLLPVPHMSPSHFAGVEISTQDSIQDFDSSPPRSDYKAPGNPIRPPGDNVRQLPKKLAMVVDSDVEKHSKKNGTEQVITINDSSQDKGEESQSSLAQFEPPNATQVEAGLSHHPRNGQPQIIAGPFSNGAAVPGADNGKGKGRATSVDVETAPQVDPGNAFEEEDQMDMGGYEDLSGGQDNLLPSSEDEPVANAAQEDLGGIDFNEFVHFEAEEEPIGPSEKAAEVDKPTTSKVFVNSTSSSAAAVVVTNGAGPSESITVVTSKKRELKDASQERPSSSKRVRFDAGVSGPAVEVSVTAGRTSSPAPVVGVHWTFGPQQFSSPRFSSPRYSSPRAPQPDLFSQIAGSQQARSSSPAVDTQISSRTSSPRTHKSDAATKAEIVEFLMKPRGYAAAASGTPLKKPSRSPEFRPSRLSQEGKNVTKADAVRVYPVEGTYHVVRTTPVRADTLGLDVSNTAGAPLPLPNGNTSLRVPSGSGHLPSPDATVPALSKEDAEELEAWRSLGKNPQSVKQVIADLSSSRDDTKEEMNNIYRRFAELSTESYDHVRRMNAAENETARMRGMLDVGLKQRDAFQKSLSAASSSEIARLKGQLKLVTEQARRTDDDLVRKKAALWDSHVARMAKEQAESQSSSDSSDDSEDITSEEEEESDSQESNESPLVFPCAWGPPSNPCGGFFVSHELLRRHVHEAHVPPSFL